MMSCRLEVETGPSRLRAQLHNVSAHDVARLFDKPVATRRPSSSRTCSELKPARGEADASLQAGTEHGNGTTGTAFLPGMSLIPVWLFSLWRRYNEQKRLADLVMKVESDGVVLIEGSTRISFT
jgi:hypothetical protein